MSVMESVTEFVFPFILQLFRDWAAFAFWQSTLVLGLCLILERFLSRSPAFAHLVLISGIFVSILTPCVSILILRTDSGIMSSGSFDALEKPFAAFIEVFAPVIFIGGILCVFMFLYDIITARHLMFRATPFPDRDLQHALLEGAKAMRNVSLPILFTSVAVKGPTVWCWGLHPAVLLPESLGEQLSTGERDVIFLHELAHITRRDHWASFFIRLCGVALFWNPLYWIVTRLTDLNADKACDLLVLLREKVSPETYTDTILRLAAGEKKRPVFQHLSRKEQLMKRIDTILDFEENRKSFSVTRTPANILVVLTAAFCLATALAFCQEKPPEVSPRPVWFGKLTDIQKRYVQWDENYFAADYNVTLPEKESERKKLEEEWTKLLEGDEPVRIRGQKNDYGQAIIGITLLKSPKAKELLVKIACERKLKDNAYRHVATKSLGMLGDKAAIPDLIPLVYHFNFNTRLDAQVALVRLTGQNFEYDADAWGKWYNENRAKLGTNLPEFDVKAVDWTFGNEDPQLRFFAQVKNQKVMDQSWLLRMQQEEPDQNRVASAPKIVKMEPENGAENVDAKTVREIRVTFDTDMSQGGFSWCGGGESFPEIQGQPRWVDKRTCVLPVKLVPGKTYQLSINCPSARNFKSEKGVSVIPVPYSFSTRK